MMGHAEEVIVFHQLDVDTGNDAIPELPSCKVVRVDTSQEPASMKKKLLKMVERPKLLMKISQLTLRSSLLSTTRDLAYNLKNRVRWTWFR